jgi:acetyltransferase-like isoleucine patch superfamily enzyme
MGCDRQEIRRLRDGFARFLAGGGRVHRFTLRSEPDRLIRDIYSVIFPGVRLPLFYVRFSIARMAERIDLSAIKVPLYRLIGIRVGRGAFIAADAVIDPHFPGLIEIGDHAIIGWGAKLFTHEWFDNTYRAGRIIIGPGAMIGAYTVVRGGVDVGAGANIGAMSIVHKDVPAGGKVINRDLLR